MMWLLALLPVYLIAVLVVARFCSLGSGTILEDSGAQERPKQPAGPPTSISGQGEGDDLVVGNL
jgi:hypothetical protein